MKIMSLTLDPAFISGLALVVSLISIVFAYIQQKIGKRNLSMTAFLESLDQLGTEEARKARGYVIKNVPDYTIEEFNPSTKEDSPEKERHKFRIAENPNDIKDMSKIVEKDILIMKFNSSDEEIFWFVASGFDKVGFMLFELGLPKELREKYLEWMGETICTVWNRIAPHLAIHRIERPNYTPHFQNLAMEAYKHYYRQMKESNSNNMPRLFIIERALQHQNYFSKKFLNKI